MSNPLAHGLSEALGHIAEIDDLKAQVQRLKEQVRRVQRELDAVKKENSTCGSVALREFFWRVIGVLDK